MPELFTLFPTTIYRTSIFKHAEFKKRLVPKLLEQYKLKPNEKAKWASLCDTCQFDIEPEDLKYIREQFDTAVQNYFNLINLPPYSYEIQGWFNVHDSLKYQEVHNHIPAILSGIYYLQFDRNKDSQVIFKNPNHQFCDLTQALGVPLQNPVFSESTHMFDEFRLEEGDLILFPGTLVHLVPKAKVQHDQLRISFSFNVIPK